jgi:hypothetical protein
MSWSGSVNLADPCIILVSGLNEGDYDKAVMGAVILIALLIVTIFVLVSLELNDDDR